MYIVHVARRSIPQMNTQYPSCVRGTKKARCTMPYDPYQGVYTYVDEQIAFPQDKPGKGQPLQRRDMVAAARQQAEQAVRQRNLRENARIPPTRQNQDDGGEAEEYDDGWPPRQPTSSIRYTVSPEQVYQQGNARVHVQQVVIPKKRRSAQPELSPGAAVQPHQAIYTDDRDEPPTQRPSMRRHVHWSLIFGLGMVLMVLAFIGFNSLATWWQTHQDDATYGRPRTFQIDAVVGHNDSASEPTHFIALNLKRHVVIIELPGGDSSKAKIYSVTTLYGDGQDLTPVTLSFKDVNNDGLLDMEIHLQDQTVVLLNDQGSFRPLKPGEKIHV